MNQLSGALILPFAFTPHLQLFKLMQVSYSYYFRALRSAKQPRVPLVTL